MNRSPEQRHHARTVAREVAQARGGPRHFITESIKQPRAQLRVPRSKPSTRRNRRRYGARTGGSSSQRGRAGGAGPSHRRGCARRSASRCASVQKFDVPLPPGTTSSLEALPGWSLALTDEDRLVARVGAIPQLKRAIELNPNFALAQAVCGSVYANERRKPRSRQVLRKA